MLVTTALNKAGVSLGQVAPRFGSDLYIYGLLALSHGFMLSSMALAAIVASAIDRQFWRASVWAFAAAALSFFGLIHGYRINASGVENHFGWAVAPEFALGYALAGVALALLQVHHSRSLHNDSPVQ